MDRKWLAEGLDFDDFKWGYVCAADLFVARHHRRHDRNPAGGASAGGEEALKK
jgi:hypothetical protein